MKYNCDLTFTENLPFCNRNLRLERISSISLFWKKYSVLSIAKHFFCFSLEKSHGLQLSGDIALRKGMFFVEMPMECRMKFICCVSINPFIFHLRSKRGLLCSTLKLILVIQWRSFKFTFQLWNSSSVDISSISLPNWKSILLLPNFV